MMPEWVSIVFNDRNSGKTTWMLEQVHEYGVQNRLAEVLIVVPNQMHKELVIRQWRARYPAITDPHIVSMQNLIPVRGRRFEKVYVDNIDFDLEGIYSDRVADIMPALAGSRDPELIFTCSPLDFVYLDPVAEARQRAEKRRAVREARKQFMRDILRRSEQSTDDG